MEELSADERAEAEASGLLAIGVLPIDLWITDEGYLVRMILEIDGTEAASPEGEFESMKLTFDMYDINRPVVIEVPPAGDVTAVEDLDMGGFGVGLTADGSQLVGDLPAPTTRNSEIAVLSREQYTP